MSDHSTPRPASRKAESDRPKKPYTDFPLTPHASGAWQKKIRGKIHYFGRWGRIKNGKMERIPGDGWEEALAIYKAQADDLHAGRTPRTTTDGLTVKELCNRFLTAKKYKLDAGEIGQRSFHEYRETTDMIVAAFDGNRLVDDLAGDDFSKLRASMAERWGPVRLGNIIGRVKCVFKYAADNGMLERPVRFGSEFKKPGRAVLRKHKADGGGRMLDAEQIRKLLDAADPQFRAMILLGINGGFGNGDCASLPTSALDLDAAWINFPRPKTGFERQCPLWPETVKAIRAVIAARPEPQPGFVGLLFLTRRGTPLIREKEKGRTDNISATFSGLARSANIHRTGVGFYTLRHVFRTIADESLDRVAIDLIMGHSDPSMGAHYRERIDDARLVRVTEHVRQWLFGKPDDRPTDGATANERTDDPTTTERPTDADAGQPALRLYVEGGAA